MSTIRPLAFALAFGLTLSCSVQADAGRPVRSLQEIIDSAPASAWRTPEPENLLYMELDRERRVIFELAPQFAPQHVQNIRQLARGKFWDGTSVYRSHDNFVVQFGDPDATHGHKRKPFPAKVETRLPAEFERPAQGLKFSALPDRDGWAAQVGFVDGFAVAREGEDGPAWLAHCYGLLGAGRENAPDSSIGAELYVVIGQAPRALDRNITSVGRVLHGIEHLSALPRGSGALGFYENPKQYTPILRLRLGSEVPEAERARIQVMDTASESFAAVVESRRNRRDEWYHRAAGHIDLCNVSVPVRIETGPRNKAADTSDNTGDDKTGRRPERKS